MTYIKNVWVDNETLVSADNMNNIESGITTIDSAITGLQSGLTTVQTDLLKKPGLRTTSGCEIFNDYVQSISTGEYCHSEGHASYSDGASTHAEGYNTSARTFASHSEGSQTLANGGTSHAEGRMTTAWATSSHAEGDTTKANGIASHAEGSGTTSNGNASHVEGLYTSAITLASHAEGYLTIANGIASHTEGSGTTSNGNASHTEGIGTITNNTSEHASGIYNASVSSNTTSASTLFSVGNGTSNNDRKNAFEIKLNGDLYNNGKIVNNFNGRLITSGSDLNTLITPGLYYWGNISAVTANTNPKLIITNTGGQAYSNNGGYIKNLPAWGYIGNTNMLTSAEYSAFTGNYFMNSPFVLEVTEIGNAFGAPIIKQTITEFNLNYFIPTDIGKNAAPKTWSRQILTTSSNLTSFGITNSMKFGSWVKNFENTMLVLTTGDNLSDVNTSELVYCSSKTPLSQLPVDNTPYSGQYDIPYDIRNGYVMTLARGSNTRLQLWWSRNGSEQWYRNMDTWVSSDANRGWGQWIKTNIPNVTIKTVSSGVETEINNITFYQSSDSPTSGIGSDGDIWFLI